MIAVVPVNEENMDGGICPSFGRAPFFLVYNFEQKTYSFLPNAGMQSSGGAGIQAAQTVLDSQATVLLTPRLGENAAEVFKGTEVKIYQTEGTGIAENLEACQAGTLSLLNEVHPGLHHGG